WKTRPRARVFHNSRPVPLPVENYPYAGGVVYAVAAAGERDCGTVGRVDRGARGARPQRRRVRRRTRPAARRRRRPPRRRGAGARRAARAERARFRLARRARAVRPPDLPARQLAPARVHLAVSVPLARPGRPARRAAASRPRPRAAPPRTRRRLPRRICLEPSDGLARARGARRARLRRPLLLRLPDAPPRR